jgi:hypothetical protein
MVIPCAIPIHSTTRDVAGVLVTDAELAELLAGTGTGSMV